MTNEVAKITPETPDHIEVDNDTAAEFIGVTGPTLGVWRCQNRYGIPFLKIGRKVRYRVRDLRAWKDSRLVTTGAK